MTFLGCTKRTPLTCCASFARRTLQADVAVDLVAETFCQAFTDRAGLRGAGDSEALAWIFGIARHQLSGYFRRGSVERRALVRLGLQLPSMSDLDYERVEELRTLGLGPARGEKDVAGRPRP
jgi:DNA-directed RNA polymerase specialized sigma24 family protein